VPAEGSTGQVHIVYSLIKRSALKDVAAIINRFNPQAFYSIEDVRFASKELFPPRRSACIMGFLGLLRMRRKGK